MARNKGWVGATCCFLLFGVVFLSQKIDVADYTAEGGLRGDPGMLLFLLPGIIASFFSARGRLLYPLFGALAAMPVCLMLQLWNTPEHSFWQELAYVMSAVFWCLLGALIVQCLLGLYRRYLR
ncbi:inner membrane protein YbjM [Samsonia erythrinae]|uniref:Putative inner membrane protein YbjM n=1 Tax=Samsonia erythrinae TaxID=160434 RepID=A0A4R3VTC7_9GAMM|nr:inner membrane protein YbjM [Samsonia erythrinae]TCV09151.1 putative inner membrane protein YbjM [Samsonia erythrinae]